MYRAIVQGGYNATDPESTLGLIMKPIPTAAPGYVVVHITLRPINPTDLVTIRSGSTARHYETPVTIGSEGFGIVEAVGEGVTSVKPGQRVVPLIWEEARTGNGSWQEFVALKEQMVVPIPDSISDECAAQFVINPWTVIGMIRDLAVPKGEYILQTAAGSVLGRQVIQLAKHQGIKTINLVRRPEQKSELLALGADEVICHTVEGEFLVVRDQQLILLKSLRQGNHRLIDHDEMTFTFRRPDGKILMLTDAVKRVREITGNKLAYGALDAVGGELTKKVTASVRRGGQVYIYGVLASTDATVRITDLFREVKLTGWILGNSWKIEEMRKHYISETLKYMEDKVIEPLVGEIFDLSEFKAAIKKSEEVGRGGKVLLASQTQV